MVGKRQSLLHKFHKYSSFGEKLTILSDKNPSCFTDSFPNRVPRLIPNRFPNTFPRPTVRCKFRSGSELHSVQTSADRFPLHISNEIPHWLRTQRIPRGIVKRSLGEILNHFPRNGLRNEFRKGFRAHPRVKIP